MAEHAQFEIQPSGTIVWQCASCGEPIARGGGYVTVNDQKVIQVQESSREKERAKEATGSRGWTLEELMSGPHAEPWFAYHPDCDPTPDDHPYAIEVERFANRGHALFWAAQVGQKSWAEHTDWLDVLRRLSIEP